MEIDSLAMQKVCKNVTRSEKAKSTGAGIQKMKKKIAKDESGKSTAPGRSG